MNVIVLYTFTSNIEAICKPNVWCKCPNFELQNNKFWRSCI